MGAGACVVADDGSTPATQDESEKLEHKRRLNHFKMLDIKMKGALDRGGVEQMIEAMLDNDSAIASKRDELLSGVSAILDCGYKTELVRNICIVEVLVLSERIRNSSKYWTCTTRCALG